MFATLLVGIAVMAQTQSTTTTDFAPLMGPTMPTTLTVWYTRTIPVVCKYDPTTQRWTGGVILTDVWIGMGGSAKSTPMWITLQGDSTKWDWKITKAFVYKNGRVVDGATLADTPNVFFSAVETFMPYGSTTWYPGGSEATINMPSGN